MLNFVYKTFEFFLCRHTFCEPGIYYIGLAIIQKTVLPNYSVGQFVIYEIFCYMLLINKNEIEFYYANVGSNISVIEELTRNFYQF